MSRTGKKVLVVDDMPSILADAAELIGDRYELETAGTGEEALRKVKEFKPDLVLMDYYMPGMDGIACMEAIHAMEDFGDLPVLMTLNNVSAISRAKVFDHGASDSILKPFVRTNLFRKIDIYLKLSEIGWKFEM